MFGGAFGSGLKNAPIPSIAFPAEFRDEVLFNIAFPQPIAEIEELSHAQDGLTARWPANAVAFVNGLIISEKMSPIYEGMGLQQAWRVIGTHQFIAILDTVRNRILDLALTIERANPQTGQPDAAPLPDETRQVIVANIYGNSTNLAVASGDITQVNVRPGDQGALRKALESVGVPSADIEALFDAIEADGAVENQMGPETKTWFGSLMARATDLGIGAAGGIIADAITHYLGIG